jgi:enamine deaminase RidA (YjgF/YER057c/UK114 family)
MTPVIINAKLPPAYDRWGICHAIRYGDLLFLSGQVPLAADGTIVGPGDAEAQTRCVFERIETILKEAGSDLENIIKILAIYVNPDDLPGIMKARLEALGGRCVPASSGFCARGLSVPGALIEIEVIAVVPSAGETKGDK